MKCFLKLFLISWIVFFSLYVIAYINTKGSLSGFDIWYKLVYTTTLAILVSWPLLFIQESRGKLVIINFILVTPILYFLGNVVIRIAWGVFQGAPSQISSLIFYVLVPITTFTVTVSEIAKIDPIFKLVFFITFVLLTLTPLLINRYSKTSV